MADGTVADLDTRDIDARGIDFKNKLGKTETITSAVFSVEPSTGLLVVGNAVVVGAQCSATLKAEADGAYVLSCEVETSLGRRINRSVTLSVLDR